MIKSTMIVSFIVALSYITIDYQKFNCPVVNGCLVRVKTFEMSPVPRREFGCGFFRIDKLDTGILVAIVDGITEPIDDSGKTVRVYDGKNIIIEYSGLDSVFVKSGEKLRKGDTIGLIWTDTIAKVDIDFLNSKKMLPVFDCDECMK